MSLSARSGQDPSALLVALLSAAALAAALVMQHAYDVQPCAWCALLRLIFLALGLVAFAGWVLRRRRAAVWIAGMLALALAGAGVAAGLYLHLVAAKSSSCAFTIADKIVMGFGLDQALPAMFKVTAACDAAIAPVLGIPSALWSVLLFAVAIPLVLRSLRG